MHAAHATRYVGLKRLNALSTTKAAFKEKLDIANKRHVLREKVWISVEYPANGGFLVAFPRNVQL